MRDKYTNLSLEEAFGLLNHWRSASTRLFLKLSSLSGVSVEGTVRVVEVSFPVTVRFTEGADESTSIGVSLVGANLLRTSSPDSDEPRWFACRCEPDLRFVLSEEEINLDDFDLVSTQEQ